MSHVSALPAPTSSSGFTSNLDDTAVEAALSAIQSLPIQFLGCDPLDATVGIVGAAAVARLLYLASGHQKAWAVLQKLLSFVRRVKN